MHKRFFMKSLVAGALLAAGTFAGSGAALAQEVTLRMHQFLPPQANVPAKVLIPWAKRVEEASDGRIKVEVFSAMALGGTPPQLIDQARDGVVDIVWTLPGYSPGRFPRAEVFELPFMMTDAEAGYGGVSPLSTIETGGSLMENPFKTKGRNHRARDVNFGEDACLSRTAHAPVNCALCNCIALAIILSRCSTVAETRRHFALHRSDAIQAVLSPV